jgi:hypothetical protein
MFTYKGQGAENGGGGTAVTLGVPTNAAGDLLICFLYSEGSGVATAESTSGWTRKVGPAYAFSQVGQVFYKWSNGSLPGSVTFTNTDATYQEGVIVCYSSDAQSSGDPFGVLGTWTYSTGGTTLVLPSLTSEAYGDLLVGYVNHFNASGGGSMSAGTVRVAAGDCLVSDEVLGNPGATGTRTQTGAGTDTYGGLLFTLRAFPPTAAGLRQHIAPWGAGSAAPQSSSSFTPVAGNLLLAFNIDVATGGANTGFTTLNLPGQFNNAGGDTDFASYKTAAAGAQTITSTGTQVWGDAFEYAGAGTPTSIAGVNRTTTTAPSGTATVVPVGYVLVAYCQDFSGGNTITPTGAGVMLSQVTSGSGSWCVAEWAGTGGSITPAFSAVTNSGFAIIQVLIPFGPRLQQIIPFWNSSSPSDSSSFTPAAAGNVVAVKVQNSAGNNRAVDVKVTSGLAPYNVALAATNDSNADTHGISYLAVSAGSQQIRLVGTAGGDTMQGYASEWSNVGTVTNVSYVYR